MMMNNDCRNYALIPAIFLMLFALVKVIVQVSLMKGMEKKMPAPVLKKPSTIEKEV